ncbi:MAG: phage tail protein [Methanosarcinales archaeon]
MVEFSLVYNITARISQALTGLRNVASGIEDLGRTSRRSTRDTERNLLVQKLSWLAWAAAVGYSVREMILRSTVLSTFIRGLGSIFMAFLDTALAPLIPFFVRIIGWLMRLYRWWRNLPAPVRGAIGAFLLLLGSLATVITFLKAFGFILMPLLHIFRFVWLGILAVTRLAVAGIAALIGAGPIGWAILAIIGIVTFLLLAWKYNWFGMRDVLNRVGAAIKAGILAVAGFLRDLGAKIVEFFAGLPQFFSELPGKIAGALSTAGSIIASWAASAKNTIVTFFTSLPEQARSGFDALREKCSSGLETIHNFFQEHFPTLTRIVDSTISVLRSKLSEGLSSMVSVTRDNLPLMRSAWDKLLRGDIPGAFQDWSQFIMNISKGTFDTLNNLTGGRLGEWLSIAVEKFNDFADKAKQFGSEVVDRIRSFGSAFLEAGRYLVDELVRGLANIGDRIWNAIRAGLSDVANKLRDWASGLISFSPRISEIPLVFAQTLSRGFAARGFETSRVHVGMPVAESRVIQFSPAITVNVEVREEGKSPEELADEIASLLQRKMEAIL